MDPQEEPVEPQGQPVSPAEASLANVEAITGNNKHSQDVLKKFQWAINKVANEHGTNKETSLSEEELTQLIRTWAMWVHPTRLYLKSQNTDHCQEQESRFWFDIHI